MVFVQPKSKVRAGCDSGLLVNTGIVTLHPRRNLTVHCSVSEKGNTKVCQRKILETPQKLTVK